MSKSLTILSLGLLLGTMTPSKAQLLMRGNRYPSVTIGGTLVMDSLNVQGKSFDILRQIKQPYAIEGRTATNIQPNAKGFYPTSSVNQNAKAVMDVYSFNVVSPTYTKGSLSIKGTGRYAIYWDNELLGSNESHPANSDSVPALSVPFSLEASHARLQVRSLRLPSDSLSSDFSLSFTPDKGLPQLDSMATVSGTRYIDWEYITHGKRLYYASVSPSGKYVLVTYSYKTPKAGATYQELRDASGKVIRTTQGLSGAQWLPKQDILVQQRSNGLRRQLLKINTVSGETSVWVDYLPGTSYMISPDEKIIYFYQEEKGPRKESLAIRRVSTDDRMPSWRNRTTIYRYNISDGGYEPLLYGLNSCRIDDISLDGKQLLISRHRTDITRTPYELTDLYLYSTETDKIDTLLKEQFDIAGSSFIPGSNDLLINASPNAFKGIAKTLAEGVTANGYERELFRYTIGSGKIVPLTKDFDPSIIELKYSQKLNAFIFSAENGSRKSLYKLDLKSNRISPIPISEDVVRYFSVAEHGTDLWYIGQSLNNADKLYKINASGKQQLVWDLSKEKLEDVRFNPGKDFVYTTPDGTKIDCWYYLPPNFDPNKKYPMIVYYYGGTVPVTRQLETVYDLAMFASQGYVAFSLNPRGCTGYGQKFAADHLNAWGDKTADDIIGAVKAFSDQHSFVDSKKIGCCGASYGGFMTQYLQTKTNMFAAAISHAGISSISSYWANGYWGIGYSSVASAGSYPWNNPDLYTKHSPLFNADKIHTPLLLLHGTADVNVPPSESTALYNALKILGRPVELVEITGEDHHIMEPDRQDIWMRTICAWFAKYLQDKPQWWDSLYPKTPYEK